MKNAYSLMAIPDLSSGHSNFNVTDRSQCRGSDSNADLVRIVRDDQVYRLDDHFFVSPLLVYEYGMPYEPTQEITIECKHIFTSARPTKTPRAVAGAGQMDGSLSGKRLDVEMLQAAFQKSSSTAWRCMLCMCEVSEYMPDCK